MKSSNAETFRFRSAGIALALAVFVPVLLADEPAKAAEKAGDQAADKTASKIEDYRANDTEMNKAEVKAALAQVDAELKHLDALADAAPTAQQKADAKARLRKRMRRLEWSKIEGFPRVKEFRMHLHQRQQHFARSRCLPRSGRPHKRAP